MLSEKLSQIVVQGMLEKKASDIVVMDLSKVENAIANFFVICSGSSDTQSDSIADSIDEQVHKNLGEDPWHYEGRENKEWILLDYVDVVAHIFSKDRREFYALENLWGDAKVMRIESTD